MAVKQDLALAWRILGSTRIYVAMVGAAVLVLAAIGLWHLIAPARTRESLAQTSPAPSPTPAAEAATARISPAAQISPSVATVLSPSPPATPPQRAVAITDVTQERRRGPRGETFVVATIGLAAQTNIDRDDLEVRISFFDLTPSNEMRPTSARVTYQWLTPVRDWSDPAPKFLAATYFKPRPPPWVRERLRYGGFVVRVYCDGKLQDERSEPEGLLASLRGDTPPPGPASPVTVASVTPPPPPVSAAPPKNVATTSPTPSPTSAPKTGDPNESLPYGKVVPGKPGFVSSPYDPKFLIDVRGFPPGTLVIDPNTNKPFRVP